MRDNAAARATRADEYAARFLRPVESPSPEQQPRRREPRPRAYGNRPQTSARPLYLADGIEGRRTIQITGQAARPRRRSSTTTALVARPDRAAMWAFMLAVFLVFMALATAHG